VPNDHDLTSDALRELPPVDLLLHRLEGVSDAASVPRTLLLAWVREEVNQARADIRRPSAAETAVGPPRSARGVRSRDEWLGVLEERIQKRLRERRFSGLRRVINATGVLLHTNLGRAPLAASSQRALVEAAAGYSNLEVDLHSGLRKSRLDSIRRLLPLVTGAEAGLAVHNNAAAVYLALTALAAGREVVVSRGHLVEIGGSFRLPDIMAASGAKLVEVGSTNRTRIEDYARVLGQKTALVLKVHPSNFRMVGFTEEVATSELAELAHEHGIPLLHDVGSGALRQHGPLAFDEPRVQDSLLHGSDLVCFSADKLLGGPQAGLLVGTKEWIDRLAHHPVARVVRLDKASLAALEATLEAYLDPDTLARRIPLLVLLAREANEIRECAERVAALLRDRLTPAWEIAVVETVAQVGGGTLPGLNLPSWAVSLSAPGRDLETLARVLRQATPPVIGRIEKGRFLLDMRALLPGDEELAAEAIGARLAEPEELP
jgi:L-seryl-tRNA(Ser) seleniumtransferase